MLTIRRLIRDTWNIAHTARHDVIPDEVEEVCHGTPVTSATYKGRIRVVGPTQSRRMLTVILAPTDEQGGLLSRHRSACGSQGAQELRATARITAPMSKRKASKPGRIPEFASIEEEAAFWDTHSTADYEKEFKPVRVRFAKRLSTGVTIRLDPDTLERLRTLAHQQGIGPTTLIRMWVLERLKQQDGSSQPDRAPAGR